MNFLRVGIDIGSTTVKVVVLNENNNILFSRYTRHHSKVREKALEILTEAAKILKNCPLTISLSGSAALSVSQLTGIDFVQEVFATKTAVDTLLVGTDVVVELGGEDAKILFLSGGNEERMNGSCAGGTGAFIDQMASLLSLSITELDTLSMEHSHIYNIASRCGVFAKSDIQPLLNQGANKSDIAASIYQAIVSQTIAGLAQGREIKGKVVFLGGPLTFLLGLRERFVSTLELDNNHAIFPENSQFYVAIGAALESQENKQATFDELVKKLQDTSGNKNSIDSMEPLFENQAAYDEFSARHAKNSVPTIDITTYSGDAYLGIDAGSTTTKLVLITPTGELLYTYYTSNFGEPLLVVKEQLIQILEQCADKINIKASAITGYGEELIGNAFHIDYGIVETVAHFYAAKHWSPNVDFIMDIGGQDMKCFKLKNGVVDSIMLNEACSSGCGSFIETFAHALGFNVADFAKEGLFAKHPVNLGSRCTVFMNSSVKQAQKDGAGVDDISAGLCVSVVKNAVYKVIRARNAAELGTNIVVQGGTFLNDTILRAFEREIGRNVIRPSISGLMGAYGAALFASAKNNNQTKLISLQAIKSFTHTAKMTECKLCTNHCKLTVNTFNKSDKYISGNRCERPLGKNTAAALPDAYEYKLNKLLSFKGKENAPLGKIGIPLGLNMYENLPFWHTLLTGIGFEVITTGSSTRNLYISGQHTVPSDTVCYPAKLLHGHIEELLKENIDTIFYPCMPYNFDEKMGDNHYNCPVVAYYPELLSANIIALRDIKFLNPYFAPHNSKGFIKACVKYFSEQFGVPSKVVKSAIKEGYQAQTAFHQDVYNFGETAINYAKDNNKEIIILAGRPYHIDPEINHGINKLLTSLGIVVISEDCLPPSDKVKLNVLNQWTYHSRLYNAAKYVTEHKNINLVQLVSFGCGLDAITTDEIKDILEDGDRIYTQIKIDEINNLGAAKIRLRSLIEAVKTKNERMQ